MKKFRLSRHLLVTLEELDGIPGPANLVLTSLLTGDHLLTEAAELERLGAISTSTWSPASTISELGFDPERIDKLAQLGMLVVEGGEPDLERIRNREEKLESSHWPPAAAIYHLLNHHRESRMVPLGKVVKTANREILAPDRAAAFVSLNGPPPAAFYSHQPHSAVVELPDGSEGSTPLQKVLLNRRTCRYFDSSRAIELATLGQMLRLVFGVWAKRTLPGVGELLLKTSPSGGSLHPIEAYPLVFRCEGLASGLYHYRVEDHSLEKIHEKDEAELRRLAMFWGQGQEFAGSCSLVVVLVARFERNYWKYRGRDNSYAVVLQDAGHLSQTFQLVATDLGLGSFYTGAINSEAICRELELDYPAKAPLGLLGVGYASDQPAVESAIEAHEPKPIKADNSASGPRN